MKAITFKAATGTVLALGAAACVPSSEPPVAETSSPTTAVSAPAPTPTATPTPTPVATLAAPEYRNYLDAPQTQGTWRYIAESNETFALFGTAIENSQFIIRCELQSRKVGIGRFGVEAGSALMRIRTETREGMFDATGRDSGQPLVAAELDANDPLLDAMAITKGRIAVETAGMPTLYLPAWAEVTRVIEDCR